MGRLRTIAGLAIAFNLGAATGVFAEPPTVYAPIVVERLVPVVIPVTPAPTIAPTIAPTPSPTLAPAKAEPTHQGVVISGTASWYASWCNCNAMTDQRWRGQIVHIVGPNGFADVKINDAGPVPSLKRVADLNPTVFQKVCGALSKGICTVTITGP